MYKQTGGIFVNNYTNFAEDVLLHIYGKVSNTEYQMILATGLKAVKLDNFLDSKNGADTDKDGLTDWKEVDTKSKLIKWDSKGNIIIPTFGVHIIIQ